MNWNDFTSIMNIFTTAYGKDFNQEQLKIWYGFFMDTSKEDFNKTIQRIVLKNKYMPSIAEVREELSKQELDNLQLDVEEEWAKVRKWMRDYREDKKAEVIAEFGPLTTRVVEAMGWDRILQQLSSSDVGIEHNRFKQIFESLQKTYSNTSVLNPAIRNLVESKRMDQLSDYDKEVVNNKYYLD